MEHASVLNTVKYLEEQGFEVTWLPVDEHGHIRLEDLEAALREDTILVSMMYVNNEIGALEPVEEAAKLIHQKNPKIIFMWMPYRHLENTEFIRSDRELMP